MAVSWKSGKMIGLKPVGRLPNSLSVDRYHDSSEDSSVNLKLLQSHSNIL